MEEALKMNWMTKRMKAMRRTIYREKRAMPRNWRKRLRH
jgi:hypothetical protein